MSPPPSRSWQLELPTSTAFGSPSLSDSAGDSSQLDVDYLNQKLTLRRTTASRRSFAIALAATIAIDALPYRKEQRSSEERQRSMGLACDDDVAAA
nr:hypothetical protein Iba_chr14fCG13320 [Ipomoea batatas]